MSSVQGRVKKSGLFENYIREQGITSDSKPGRGEEEWTAASHIGYKP